MKSLKRSTAVLLAAVMLILPVTSCSKGSKDTSAEDAEATVTAYMDNLIAGKFSKNSKYVKGNDGMTELELNDDESAVLESLLSCASYEIIASDVSSDSGKGDVTIELSTVDLTKVMDEGPANAEEATGIIEELSGKDKNLITEELKIKMTMEEEDWLISSKGTDTVADYLLGLIENVSFNAVSEEEAYEIVNSYYALLQSGDLEASSSLLLFPEDEDLQLLNTFDRLMVESFYANMSYSLSTIGIDEESVTITADVTGPDLTTLSLELYNDRDLMVAIFADELYTGLSGEDYDGEDITPEVVSRIRDFVSSRVASVATTGFTQDVVVVRDGGELKLIPAELDNTISTGADVPSDLSSEYLGAAITLLYEDGRLGADDAAAIYQATFGVFPDWYETDVTPTPGQFPGGLDDDGRAPEEVLRDQTEQCVLFEDESAPEAPEVSNEPYIFTNETGEISDVLYMDLNGDEVVDFCNTMDGFVINVKTRDGLSPDITFLYDIYYRGEYLGTSWTTSTSGYVATNDIFIGYTDPNGLRQGDYIINLYDVGGTRNTLLTTISFIVYESQG
ncbi:MAG: hypothetical protein II167_00055 [Clostridiales bacterium]|nr:hypothetical protein [Clostridiales bacterium]